jgi:hypothetical protein
MRPRLHVILQKDWLALDKSATSLRQFSQTRDGIPLAHSAQSRDSWQLICARPRFSILSLVDRLR